MDVHRKIRLTQNALNPLFCVFVIFFPASFVLFSCVTNAKIKPQEKTPLSILSNAIAGTLPSGADGYFAADAKALSQLLIPLLKKYRMDTKEIRAIIKKTISAGGAYFPAEKTNPFIVNLNGRGYPAFGAKFILGANKLWKKESYEKKTFFYSERFRMAVDIGAKLIKIAPRNPYQYMARPPMTEELPDWISGAVLTAWSPRAALLNNYLQSRRIDIRFPARALYAAVYPAGTAYKLVLCVEAENEARANSIQSLLRLARSALEEGGLQVPEAARRILRAETSVNGCNVFLDAGIFSVEEILQLLK